MLLEGNLESKQAVSREYKCLEDRLNIDMSSLENIDV